MKKIILSLFLLGTLLYANAQVPNYVPSNGLVGWWPFSGNANDISGNGNNGKVSGASLVNDRNGSPNKAYDFNGSNNYISMDSMNKIPFGRNARTVSLWMNPSSIATNWTWTAIAYGSASTSNAFMFGLGNGIISAQGWADDYAATLNYSVGQWIHTVCTYDGSNIKMYIDGNLIGSGTKTTWNTIGSEFYFGARPSMGVGFFTGKLDDIGIWNRVLSSAEIKDLYNGCKLSISKEPVSQTININQQAQFIISTNDNSATYQWQSDIGAGFQNLSNAGQYSGVQNDTLSLSNVTKQNNNQNFRCIVKSGSCIDTSNLAVLKVFDNVAVESLKIENINVYPVPSSTQVIIDNGNYSTMGSYMAKIVNTAGQQMFQSVINQQQFVIDAKTMGGAGVYTLYITDANNKVVGVKKIVLQ